MDEQICLGRSVEGRTHVMIGVWSGAQSPAQV